MGFEGHHLVDMWSENRIRLQREITKHPKLLAELVNEGIRTLEEHKWPEVVTVAAGYCGIAMEGWYSVQDFENLEIIVHDRLRLLRQKDERIIIV